MKGEYETDLVCDTCGVPGVRVLHLSKSYGEGNDLLVIEHVPLVSCPACRASYLTAATLREIESIKRNRSEVAPERPVPVAVFST